mmetsp:Transcript_791/g.957  ORF Transcript_791/g.957 Transcript_791/m.957 type:complete len:121 (-) Transcript_791:125-487(-)|eukprot:CAMPEP_0194136544 /NCGR_PEP_ID=MMETSP0152-20130528/6555_1 /TAXON_ID=1049557 /ORGANISM="Thalassiothrix antarctica, Strain L6-D1" /LENGTH=120 /DNA_ID=CAMNT_0038833251 /DNA_START=121 /DNA_END=483 /DNA_ORIENTATION=-
MDSLSKSQKDEYATSYAILALHDGGAEITSDQICALLEATGNTEVEAYYPIIFANFLSDPETLCKYVCTPGGGGGGDSSGGAEVAEVEKEEEKEEEEEEEAEIGGGMDMFGGDEGGGGDY